MTTTKGKALRQDFAHYDGISLKGSRKDSTGGFIKGLRIGDEVDVLMVYGQGENYTDQTIQNAINSLGSNSATLKFAPGTWVISDDVTVPSTLSARIPAGVTFNVASGKTLTFSGPVFRDSETWTSGSGTVSATKDIYYAGLERWSIDASVASDDLTVSIESSDGSALSSTNTVTFRFRSNTLTSGVYQNVTFNAATSITLPAGGTMGFSNSETGYIHVYACYDGTNKEVGLARRVLDEGIFHSSTAIGTGSDSASPLYTTTALTNAAIRLIGRIKIAYGTAVWDSAPTEVTVWTSGMSTEIKGSYTGTLTGLTTTPTITINYSIIGNAVTVVTGAGVTGTSNSTSFTITGAPAIIFPDNTSGYHPCRVFDNGGVISGEASMSTSGVLAFSVLGVAAGFTGSGTKGISTGRRVEFTYKLTNPA